MKILVACGNGMGSSVLLKLKIEQVLREHEVNAVVEAYSVGEAVSIANDFDILLYPKSFENRVGSVKIAKAGIVNMVSSVEIEKAFRELGLIR